MIKEIIERNREESDEIKKIYNVFCESAKEDEKAKRLFQSLYQDAKDYIECRRAWNCLSDIEACRKMRKEVNYMRFLFSISRDA